MHFIPTATIRAISSLSVILAKHASKLCKDRRSPHQSFVKNQRRLGQLALPNADAHPFDALSAP
jgi:hypothetical protein